MFVYNNQIFRQDQERQNTLRHDFDLASSINARVPSLPSCSSSSSMAPPVLAPVTPGAATGGTVPQHPPHLAFNQATAGFGLGQPGGIGSSPFSPLQQAAAAGLISPGQTCWSAGLTGSGATSTVPNDPVNLDRSVDNVINFHLQGG